ncbi:MAG: branched-chain amino acid ABC transporter permease [Hyphomicrobiales bacterium]
MDLLLQQLFNGVIIGSTYALVALGFTLVLGTLDLLNFAHGETIMACAYAALLAALLAGLPFPLVALCAMVVGAVIAAGIYLASFRWVDKSVWTAPALSTVGVALLLQTGASRIFGSDQRQVPDALAEIQMQLGPVTIAATHVVIILTTLALMIGLHLLLTRTRLGMAMRAVSESNTVAALLGIPVERTVASTLVISGALAGAAGALTSLVYHTITPFIGLNLLLKGMTGMVLGGLGNVYGAMLGGLLVGLLETLVVSYWSSTYQDLVVFSVLILTLMFRPAGLLGAQIRERA